MADLSQPNNPLATNSETHLSRLGSEVEEPWYRSFIDQIKDRTLAEVAPMSQGALDEAKLKSIQAELDAIK